MTHIFFTVAPVPIANKDKYIEVSQKIGEKMRKLGALSYVEAWQNTVPDGEITSMPMAVQRKDDEAITVAWIEWPSKAFADEAFEKMQQNPEIMELMDSGLIDGKRVIYGNFDKVVDL